MKRVLLAGGLILMPALLLLAEARVDQRAGGGGQFPGGTNPDGSLRPSAPVTRPFTQDAYTQYELLEPGSESFRITFLPEATRGGSEGSGVEVYDPRTGSPLKFAYEPAGNDPDSHQIRATLPRPVPDG